MNVRNLPSWRFLKLCVSLSLFYLEQMDAIHGTKSDPQGKWPTSHLNFKIPIRICYRDNKPLLLEGPCKRWLLSWVGVKDNNTNTIMLADTSVLWKTNSPEIQYHNVFRGPSTRTAIKHLTLSTREFVCMTICANNVSTARVWQSSKIRQPIAAV